MDRCPDAAGCSPEKRCASCHGRDQAQRIGQTWAERIARTHAGLEDWPAHEERTIYIAQRLVRELAADPVELEELATVCLRAGAEWWRQYRR